MTPHTRTIGLILALLVLAGCAGPNPLLDEPVLISEVSGFWGGLWHGLTLPISFVGSLFTDWISIYAVQNTGGGYDIGYVLGIVLLWLFVSIWAD